MFFKRYAAPNVAIIIKDGNSMPVLLFNFADSWFVINYEFLFLMQSYGVKIKKHCTILQLCCINLRNCLDGGVISLAGVCATAPPIWG